MLEYFATNLSFYVFITRPELFSPHVILHVDDRLEKMLLLRSKPRVWN